MQEHIKIGHLQHALDKLNITGYELKRGPTGKMRKKAFHENKAKEKEILMAKWADIKTVLLKEGVEP